MEHRTELSTAIQTCQYHANAAATILKLNKPSKTGHNYHAASKHARTWKFNQQVRPKQSTTFLNCPEGPSSLQSHQKLYKTYNNHAKAGKTILNWEEPFELTKAMKQHLTIGIRRQINPLSRPEPTTNV